MANEIVIDSEIVDGQVGTAFIGSGNKSLAEAIQITYATGMTVRRGYPFPVGKVTEYAPYQYNLGRDYLGKYIYSEETGKWYKATSFTYSLDPADSTKNRHFVTGPEASASGKAYTDKNILGANAELSVDIMGEELYEDNFTPTLMGLYKDTHAATILRPTDYDGMISLDRHILATDLQERTADFASLKYGQGIDWVNGGNRIGKFFVRNVERVAKNAYQINSMSGIGLLESMQHDGGVYLAGDNVKFKTLLDDILSLNPEKRFIKNGAKQAKYVLKNNTAINVSTSSISITFDTSILFTVEATSQSMTWNMIPGSGLSVQNVFLSFGIYGGRFSYLAQFGSNMVSGEIEIEGGESLGEHVVGIVSKRSGDTRIGYVYFDGTLREISRPSYFSEPLRLSFSSGGIVKEIKIWQSEIFADDFVPIVKDGAIYFLDLINNVSLSLGYFNSTSAQIGSYIEIEPAIEYTLGRTPEEREKLLSLNVSGWLPRSSKRANLHSLLMAYNIAMVKSADGRVTFTWLTQDGATPIPEDETSMGGTIEYPSPSSRADVTEYSYWITGSETSEKLYETDLAVEHKLVQFQNAPIQVNTVTSNGLTIEKICENYAIVTGTGRLAGKPYSKSESVYTEENPDAEEEKVVTISGNTMINAANGPGVAKRFLEYDKTARKIKSAIYGSGLKPGSPYTLIDPYEADAAGFLTKMSYIASAKLKADCEFVTGYVPSGGGDFYTKSVILDSVGEYIDFAALGINPKSMQIIVVGGGTNGSDGEDGEAGHRGDSGQWPDLDGDGAGGEGGEGGAGGHGAKVFTAVINNPKSIANRWSVSAIGTNGGATTFGPSTDTDMYSSANGAYGTYVNPITGDIYAQDGTAGTKGSNGGSADVHDAQDRYSFMNGAKNGDDYALRGNIYRGGQKSEGRAVAEYNQQTGYFYLTSSGAAGGGAANGRAGEAATRASYEYDYDLDTYQIQLAKGGDGANATATPAARTEIGRGGDGGHGGGGGGGGGSYKEFGIKAEGYNDPIVWPSEGGEGGNGGLGGTAGPGAVIILY